MSQNATWRGLCLKCAAPLKSAHHSGVCRSCREQKCKKCGNAFRPSAKSPSNCSKCRKKNNGDEYRFNLNEEHYL